MKSIILAQAIAAIQLTTVLLCAREVPSEEAAAQQAASAHDYPAARNLYSKLTKEHPDKAEYWIWVGRLSGYLGDYPSALSAYDHALRIAPNDVDAITGKAYVLLYEHQYVAAGSLLSRASTLAPDSPEVNIAIAREKFYEGSTAEATKYTQLILAKDPTNKEALELRARLLPPRHIRVELGITGDELPFAPFGVSGLVDVGVVSPGNFISGRYEDWSRFGERLVRGGFTFSHTFHHLWTIDTVNLIGSRGDVLPRYDDSIAISRRFRSSWVASANYRDLLFDQAHVELLGPGIEYYFESPIWLQANYFRTWTTYNTGSIALGQPANSISLRYNQRISRVTVHAGWARGSEFFVSPVIDQLGQFRENTYLTGIDVPVSRVLTPKFEYDLEQRSSGVLEQIFAARVVFQK